MQKVLDALFLKSVCWCLRCFGKPGSAHKLSRRSKNMPCSEDVKIYFDISGSVEIVMYKVIWNVCCTELLPLFSFLTLSGLVISILGTSVEKDTTFTCHPQSTLCLRITKEYNTRYSGIFTGPKAEETWIKLRCKFWDASWFPYCTSSI